MTARFATVRAILRRNPAGSAAAYGVWCLNLGLTPRLRDSHGPDAGQATYDEVCRDHGYDPLGWRLGVRS
jgi:hypothetical protein